MQRARLKEDAIVERLGKAQGWAREGNWIRKEFRFPTFAEAVSFVNRIARVADELDHHPDIDIRYDRVRLLTSTHSEGGLTELDFELARRIDEQSAS